MKSRRKSALQRSWDEFTYRIGWLVPGLGIKRWLGLILAGTTLIGLGLAVLVIDFYRTAPDTWWLPALSYLSLRFLDRPLRALIFGGLGIGAILVGVYQLNRSLLRPFLQPGTPVLKTVSTFRKRERGPRVVAIGGGTGLSMLLRGLKTHTHNLTAVVTVADDGGSSGELRRSMGVLPPGDIRNCLAALSDDETLMTQIFQYRFAGSTGLGGHSLGNLFITALADITGSFEEGVVESARVLAIKGRVLPSTLHDVRLVADVQIPDVKAEVRIKGESRIPEAAGKVRQVWLEPNAPLAFPPAIQAILTADVIVVGPGSLYTSIIPNLLVPDISEAVHSSRALKIFVCNVATQAGETDHYSCREHVEAIQNHTSTQLFDLVICNNRYTHPGGEDIEWVTCDPRQGENYAIYASDLIDKENPRRHDSKRLAQLIMDLYYERTGPANLKDSLSGE